MVDLECCPFCGEHAIRVQHPGYNWDGKEGKYINIGASYGLWYVGCPHPFFESSVKHCEVAPSASWFAELEEAEKQWNKRAETKLEFVDIPKIRIFGLDKDQEEKLKKWAGHCDTYAGAIGGRLKFIFTPTGLGDGITVECICGEKLDLTDSENW